MTFRALPKTGRSRTVIERVSPEVDSGRFPIKRTVGEEVIVDADIFADGHDQIRCLLLHRQTGSKDWTEVEMKPLGNDRWQARFRVTTPGRHEYTIDAWTDPFLTWRHDLARREEAADINTALQVGVMLIKEAASRAGGAAAIDLKRWADELSNDSPPKDRQALALSKVLAKLVATYAERPFITEYDRVLEITVDTERARFSTWYELFPRSCLSGNETHGNFASVIKLLPYVAEMGFDVVYLPPIHPIGQSFRKGPNNQLKAGPKDPGSPWAIGSTKGGHKDIHAQLGSAQDFRKLIDQAHAHGLEVALDIAFQCSPDHPYVAQHPEWFRHRPDGSIQYAENPPKKYQDIYPLDFESEEWKSLWRELKAVVLHWIDEGVRIFRVDNPHTKPFAFWEWMIGSIKTEHPDVIFLAEAFTRPKVMHRLAKVGFTQSYTYFTWRNTPQELTEYFTELSQDESREYFRPNLWPNTPDILPEILQYGGRPAFLLRVALAATLGANYGIYGPAYELMEHEAVKPGSEEYLDSEKYQLRRWDLGRPDSLRDFIARLNRIRRENPALQSDWSLRFHPIDNSMMLCYSKTTNEDALVMVVNLDLNNIQNAWTDLPLGRLGIPDNEPYEVHDLLSGERYRWQGHRNFVSLDPNKAPMHILHISRLYPVEPDFGRRS